MGRAFVAINDPVHRLLRDLTRRLPLELTLPAGPNPRFEYQFRVSDLPESYFSLARFHALDGLPPARAVLNRWRVDPAEKGSLLEQVNYFDVTRLDRRCCRDLRLRLSKRGPGMLAADLLTYGTGVLRARNDDPNERIHQYIWRVHGRIQPRHEIVFATIRALHLNSLPLWHLTDKESFDSTNIIYGDAFGELEQLWERRADTEFLEQVACSLQPMRRNAEIAAFLHPPLNLTAVMKLHRGCQAVWKAPPANARALLRRIEYLLDHTSVDDYPGTAFRSLQPELQPEPLLDEDGPADWQRDRSGYDGWLWGGPGD